MAKNKGVAVLFDYETLKLIWWGLVGVILIGFAIMGGQDIGICTLLPLAGKDDDERRVIINTIGPHWEGNQTWLITAGGAVFAAFPLLYATAFSHLYWAMMATLWTLFLRPVSFKYRSLIKDDRWRRLWDYGLIIGSVIPALVFGVVFGNLFLGLDFAFDGQLVASYGGSFWHLWSPFAILCGLVSVFMLILQGGTFLAHRTEGVIQRRAIYHTIIAGALFMLCFGICGVMVGSLDGHNITSEILGGSVISPTDKTVVLTQGGWLNNFKALPALWLFPALGFLGAMGAMVLLKYKRTLTAFVASSVACFGVIMTAGVALFPFLLPSKTMPSAGLTLWDSVSSQLTLMIMLYVVVFLLPLIVAYTSWAYRVMRGKVTTAYLKENQKTLY